jgi:pyruvate dehydrogenase complex dehydrogenase (E1) component
MRSSSVVERATVYYYITLMNENYPHPAMPAGAEEGIVKGMYLLKEAGKGKGPRVQLMGSGTILREVMAAAELLKSDFKVDADLWSVTSFNELLVGSSVDPPVRCSFDAYEVRTDTRKNTDTRSWSVREAAVASIPMSR